MSIITPDRLAKLASTPLLSKSWYFVAAATFSVCNQPDEIPKIFEYMINNQTSHDDQLAVAQQIREALLKGAALGGLPKTINSLTQLKNVTPDSLREKSTQRPPLGDLDRGASFFDAVYGKISPRVRNQMASAYPDLAQYAINHVYAPLLSYTKILSPKETSLVVIACLIPQDVNPQLKGHLKGALNNGATKEEVEAVRQMAITICQWCGIQWRNPVAKL